MRRLITVILLSLVIVSFSVAQPTEKPVIQNSNRNLKGKESENDEQGKVPPSAAPRTPKNKPTPQTKKGDPNATSNNGVYKVDVVSQPVATRDPWFIAYVVITGLIAVGTLGTLCIVWRQTNFMRQQLEQMRESGNQTAELIRQGAAQVTQLGLAAQAAADNASAAILNAQAAINAERPWLVVVPKRTVNMGKDFIFEAINYGRTPAEIISGDAQITSTTNDLNLPIPPIYGGDVLLYKKLLPPRRKWEFYTFFGETDVNVRMEAKEIKEGHKRLIIYGIVRYRNVLNRSGHYTRFCYRFDPVEPFGALHLAGPEEYNEHT